MSKFVQRLPFAPIVAVLFGATAAVLVLAVPDWRFEQFVSESGLATYVAAAEPPLGIKARFLSALLVAGMVSLGLFLLLNPLAKSAERRRQPVEVDPLPMDAFGRLRRARGPDAAIDMADDLPNLPRFLQPESVAESPSAPAADSHAASLPMFFQAAMDDPAGKEGAGSAAEDELLLETVIDEMPVQPAALEAEAPIIEPVALSTAAPDLPPAPPVYAQVVPKAEAERVASFDPASCPFIGAIAERAASAPKLSAEPLYMRQPDPVLIIEPAPVQPPVPPVQPRLVAQREPSVTELMERFEEALQKLQRDDRPAGDDAVLRRAMTQLEVLVAAGGR